MSVVRVEPLTTARALRGPFDYAQPDEPVGVGARLVVPFGRQRLGAVVTELADASEYELKPPLKVLDPPLPPELVDLALWLAREYVSTPARALSLLLPPSGTKPKTALYATALVEPDTELLASLPRFCGPDTAKLRRLEKRGLVRIDRRVVRRAPLHLDVGAQRTPPPLTADQEAALATIAGATPGDRLLLHGVTGSGKTEVYLRAAERVLAAGRGVIVLVPEIGLTPQIVSRFVARFGDTVAVLHSRLGAGSATTSGCACAPARRGCASARAARSSRRWRTSGWSSSTRSTTRATSTRGTPATTRGWSPSAGPRTGCSSAGAPRPGPRARTRCAACGCPLASTAPRCQRSGSSTCAAPAACCIPTPTTRSCVSARRSCCSTGGGGRTT